MGLITKEITRKNGEIVKVENLSVGSGVSVEIECDGCRRKLTNVKWVDYRKCVKEDGKYYCNQCAKNGFKKWISFFEWCYLNLPKEMADKILARWDYILNIDKSGKSINPKDVSHGSNKLYWFKCLDNPEHISEKKNINTFTNGKQATIDCHQCNSISTYPHMLTFLVNKEDAKKYSVGSDRKILLKCPDCGYEKSKNVYDWINKGFGCPRCSDGVSYPEKFVFCFMEQLNLLFKTQLAKTTFKWCNSYKYDFYIDKINGVLEIQGNQHYEGTKGKWGSLKEIQDNDKNKERLARDNGIENYIVLDCRKSSPEWIKSSILLSDLPYLLNFKESDISWLKCHEYACSSRVKIVCDLWNSGIKNLSVIANSLKLHSTSIRNYLKQGVKLGWSDYDPKEALTHKEYLFKKVVCLTTREIFDSVLEASKKYNIDKGSISACCLRKENKSAGKHPLTGDSMVWMHYDDYIVNSEDQVKRILNSGQNKKVVCLTTGEIFNTNSDASKTYNIDPSGISSCCKNNLMSAGKNIITGKPMVWMYYNEYITKTENEIKVKINNSLNPHGRKIICVTTNEVFDSITEASIKYKVNKANISECCTPSNRKKSAGKHPKTGEKMVWEYYNKQVIKL